MSKRATITPERRKLVRLWIRFWYNDWTRLLLVFGGGHLLVTGPLLYVLGLRDEALRYGLLLVYAVIYAWGLLDNNYTNLYRIGLDEYGRPLRKPKGLLKLQARENADQASS